MVVPVCTECGPVVEGLPVLARLDLVPDPIVVLVVAPPLLLFPLLGR